MPQKPYQLWVLALASEKQPSCDKCLLRILLPRDCFLVYYVHSDIFPLSILNRYGHSELLTKNRWQARDLENWQNWQQVSLYPRQVL